MRSLTKREKFIALICLIMAAAYIGMQFFRPSGQWRDRQLLKLIADRRQVLEQDLQMIRESKAIEDRYKKNLEIFSQKESDEKEVSAMMSNVEKAANGHHIQISNMQSSRMVVRDRYKEIGIKISVTAPLITLIQFVHELQSDPYFYNIGQAQLERGPEGTTLGNLTLTKAFLR